LSYSLDLETELTEEQQLVLSTVHSFSQSEVAPLSRKVDHEHYFPKELIPKLGELGFLGINVSSNYGGSELDAVSYALIIEELARYCASTSVIVSAHNSLCLWPLEHYGNEEQKQRYLPKLCSGKWLGAFALSEPGTGSDAARQTCIAKKTDKGWILDGVKNWITNAPVADLCVIFAMTDTAKGHKGISAYLVELKNAKGVTIGKKEEKLGICGSPTASITLENVELDHAQLLGAVGEGFKIAMSTLDGGRIGIGAQAVGIARAALEDSIEYSKQRETFGVLISQHQTIQNYLADMSMSIDGARLMVIHAAKRKDQGLNYTRQAAQAKLQASETAVACALKGIQIHGGYGYVKDFNVERYLRDAKITEIYEGTSEIQRLVIAANLLK
jgi:butyryl-CoA dehydrogenase